MPSHRIYIGEAVGRGDRAVIVGIIYNGREEIRGDDEGTILIQTPDSRVVRFPQANQQVREGSGIENVFNGTQYLRQRLGA